MAFGRKKKIEEPQLEQRSISIDDVLPGWSAYSAATAHVTESQALSIPAFFRGVALKAELIAGFPLKALDGISEVPSPQILVQPDPTEDRADTISRLVTSLLTTGNAIAVLGAHDALGYARALRVVHTNQVQITEYPNGTYTYVIADREYDPSVIMHIRSGVLIPGQRWALSPVEACRRSLDRAIKTEETSRLFFAGNGTPTGVIKVMRPEFSAEEARAVKSQWVASQQGSREPIVINGKDMEYEQFTLSPQDSQFLETEMKSLTDVANIVGLPGYFLGAPGATMTYSNAEQEALNLLRFSLPELRRIERAFSNLMPEGIDARFNVDSLLRVDAATRATTEATWTAAGIYTINELREKENLGPIAGGDELSRPAQKVAANV